LTKGRGTLEKDGMKLRPILSKAPAGGQWRKRKLVAIAAGVAILLYGPASAPAKPVATPSDDAPVVGLSYATLRRAPVNARVGPGEDYKALWTFQAHGVPLQVVEESGDWRRVCDPEGGLAWVRARALDSRRTVMRIALSDLPMRRAPSTDAKVTAVLAARATAQLLTCKAGWCRISVDHASGWVRADEVWGAGDGPQCKGG
jgi:SH3-like domain-containing protein